MISQINLKMCNWLLIDIYIWTYCLVQNAGMTRVQYKYHGAHQAYEVIYSGQLYGVLNEAEASRTSPRWIL
jgi:hypothetical protein